MADETDRHQKTEQPTQKRLDEARRKGDAPRSQEIIAAAMLAAAGLALFLFGRPAAASIAEIGAAFLDHPHAFATDGVSLTRLFSSVAGALALAGAGAMLLLIAAAAAANMAQARPVFSPERLAPDLKRLSPIEGVKRIFGVAAFVNFVKGLAKIGLIGAILLYALWPDKDRVAALLGADERALLSAAMDLILKLVAVAVAAMSVVAALDYMLQRAQWIDRHKMTKEEVRRELKESEGDPQIKARVRAIREQRARRRMLAAVRKATVVIANPTHFAVALAYEAGAATAPICTAKGVDDLALRLRAEAEKHGIPVVENPPLARALHAASEIDAEIPVEHYEAVAKVIGWVMAKARRGPLGAAPRVGS